MESLDRLDPARFDNPAVLKRLASASRALGELKGAAAAIPNQGVLINTLGLQEAKDSSAIENIVTTHDELFRESLFSDDPGNAAAKEVARYADALRVGFQRVETTGLLTNNDIVTIQGALERNNAGFRRLPGTVLRDGGGNVVYTPPAPDAIPSLMDDLERFINDDAMFASDPMIKMALIHHRFETIHPFYDGNGRTGRIINVLYLVRQGLLDIPVLYMSRHIVRTKSEYYRLLQAVREHDEWEAWVVYMVGAVEETAREALSSINAIRNAFFDYKHRIRSTYRFYSQDLINSLFVHPYTKVQFFERDLDISRVTATKYLDQLAADGFVVKRRLARSNYYVNTALYQILTGEPLANA